MEVDDSFSPSNSDSEPRRALKQVARRLIAERGVRNVSVRQIGEAAGQKNKKVVAYYFGKKDKLLRERPCWRITTMPIQPDVRAPRYGISSKPPRRYSKHPASEKQSRK
jgi:hypothetical protein